MILATPLQVLTKLTMMPCSWYTFVQTFTPVSRLFAIELNLTL